jgi:uncharacterized membrane protein YhaH (DUF805 family)
METMNPYQSPNADVAARSNGSYDETGPFSPKGRFGRLSYLAWSILLYIPVWIGSMVVAVMAGVNGDPAQAMAMPAAMLVLMAFYAIALVLFTIRRLHDFNASGWWTLLFLSPMVVPLTIRTPEDLSSSMWLVASATILSLVFWLVLMLRRGTEGSNNFGPERITRGWEKVFGYIGIGFMVLAVIGIIAAIAIPTMVAR